ncbi:MAG: hypothetical protein ABGZ53_15515 [Fuerstiella sp.]
MIRFTRLFCLALLTFSIGSIAAAVDLPAGTTNTRVEEDWVAYIRNPDDSVGAPQIANVISPIPSTSGAFGMVELNHRSQPTFQDGGYQVQSWIGEYNNSVVFSEETNLLIRDYDKLEYTVGIELSGDNLEFFLKDGKSRTWGRFARDGIHADTPADGVTLADYDPQFSVDNTTINVGSHRVELLYQRETRYYSSDGLELTDSTPRVIHRFSDLIQYVSLEDYEQNEAYYNIEITE